MPTSNFIPRASLFKILYKSFIKKIDFMIYQLIAKLQLNTYEYINTWKISLKRDSAIVKQRIKKDITAYRNDEKKLTIQLCKHLKMR